MHVLVLGIFEHEQETEGERGKVCVYEREREGVVGVGVVWWV